MQPRGGPFDLAPKNGANIAGFLKAGSHLIGFKSNTSSPSSMMVPMTWKIWL
jgi:hypothetical protein